MLHVSNKRDLGRSDLGPARRASVHSAKVAEVAQKTGQSSKSRVRVSLGKKNLVEIKYKIFHLGVCSRCVIAFSWQQVMGTPNLGPPYRKNVAQNQEEPFARHT
jgi:hypothetical protein